MDDLARTPHLRIKAGPQAPRSDAEEFGRYAGNRLQADVYMRCKNGHRLAVGVRVVPIVDSKHHALGAVEVFSDIARRKQLERRNVELKKMAFLDPLTQLVNRR